MAHAVTTASKDPQEGAVLLEKFLNSLPETYKLDRLDGTKRRAFEATVNVLDNLEKGKEALSWAERWADFDDRDLFAQVWRAKLMRIN